jgi:hypothetical protein
MIITTVFTTRCWRSGLNAPKPSLRSGALTNVSVAVASGVVSHALVTLLVLFTLLVAPSAASAEGAAIRMAKLEATEDGYQLNADIDVQLTPAMQEALRKGMPLYFVVDFEINRGRWYWFDQLVARATRDRRVSYAPLTDQYRVTVAGFSQNVATIKEVQRILSRVRSWLVIDKGRLKPGEKYEAAVRFRLDNAQLPKPFQLNVLASKDWSLSSDWYRWTVSGDARATQ